MEPPIFVFLFLFMWALMTLTRPKEKRKYEFVERQLGQLNPVAAAVTKGYNAVSYFSITTFTQICGTHALN
jgi:hypothetical protein